MTLIFTEHLSDLEILNSKVQKALDDSHRLKQPIRSIRFREQFRREAILLTVEMSTEEPAPQK